MGDSVETKEYVVRTEGHFDSYGIGEVIVPGVAFFKAGDYNLSKDQLNAKLKQLGKVTLR
jgi:hypothetical protein